MYMKLWQNGRAETAASRSWKCNIAFLNWNIKISSSLQSMEQRRPIILPDVAFCAQKFAPVCIIFEELLH